MSYKTGKLASGRLVVEYGSNVVDLPEQSHGSSGSGGLPRPYFLDEKMEPVETLSPANAWFVAQLDGMVEARHRVTGDSVLLTRKQLEAWSDRFEAPPNLAEPPDRAEPDQVIVAGDNEKVLDLAPSSTPPLDARTLRTLGKKPPTTPEALVVWDAVKNIGENVVLSNLVAVCMQDEYFLVQPATAEQRIRFQITDMMKRGQLAFLP